MIRYKEIAFVAYPVTDIARARQFYEGVLNLTPNAPLQSEHPHWIEYDIGSGTAWHRVIAAMVPVAGWRLRGIGS
jgi:extradiol dioxygenase family protein